MVSSQCKCTMVKCRACHGKQGSHSMSRFENATIIKAANVYFEGKVSSRTVLLSDGSKVTLGMMQPGEYEFGTEQAEVMEIMAGKLTVRLPGSETWQSIQ